MPKHSFILPPSACGQQHMRFLFVTFLKMSLNGNSSGLKVLQVLRKLGSLNYVVLLTFIWNLEILNVEWENI